MYRVVRASILYYYNNMKGAGSRYELIKPYILLINTKQFREAQLKETREYKNLCDIIAKMKHLYDTREAIYHHFGMLLQELEILGFSIKNIKEYGTTPPDVLKDQIDLLLQFLAYRYPFDEYDNKTGTHYYKTNEWIFEQP